MPHKPRSRKGFVMDTTNEDWIEWAGGECPVPADTPVNIKTADSDTAWEIECAPAGLFSEGVCDWWSGDGGCHEWRIIAYRVVPQ